MKSRDGKIGRQLRHRFIISNGAPVRFGALAAHCYPRAIRLAHWQRWSIYRALAIYGEPVRWGWWRPNKALRQRILGNDVLATSSATSKQQMQQ
jgi:hypothetical protein